MPKSLEIVARGAAGPLALATLVGVVSLAEATADAATKAQVPLVCSRGGGQTYMAHVSVPGEAAEGAVYAVRIDGHNSGAISHTGLNHIRDMTTEYALPPGTSLVDGSLKVVPGTGTANVAAGAKVVHQGGKIRMMLPGKVEAGSSFTAPSLELQVKVNAKAGASLPLQLLQYKVTANAFLIGDVETTCDPQPKPYAIGTTRVTSAPPAPPATPPAAP
jgi:hypothetical protein